MDEDTVENVPDVGANADADADSDDGPKEEPIDMTVVVREAEQARVEIKRTEVLLAVAKQEVLAAQEKGNIAAASASVERLNRLLATQRARAATTAAGSEDWLATASSARLSSVVQTKLHEAIAQMSSSPDRAALHDVDRRVVGVSCGLDYRTPEAVHPRTGRAVREAQRAACLLAITAAVDAGLPLFLECHDAPPSGLTARPAGAHTMGLPASVEAEPTPEPEPEPIESASSDLVKILVKAAPPSTTLILRSGSLTTAPKPGLPKLMQVWPKLFVGMTAHLSLQWFLIWIVSSYGFVPLAMTCWRGWI